ncbi:hypothetical protein Patl1_30696 [Pistacia atlantica]|uniref:Uncharacterized protein n=1 Tax=Pistacia atlantica TaxID=434234 RepID=A0ACC1ADL3_9ROSI|nr:hypothetical protein Patl1_30696 [Pistacia atlantica]
MARDLRHVMKPWIEVAPPLTGLPRIASNAPKLETIREEYEEEEQED